jgi:hypothetical protein
VFELVEGLVGGFEPDELNVLCQSKLLGNVQRCRKRIFGFNGKDADLVFGIAVAAENQAESANDQEREQEIPPKGGPITQKFTIPGDKKRPEPIELHGYSLS